MQLPTLLKINSKLGSKVLLHLECLVLQVFKGLQLLNEYFIEKKFSSGIPNPEIAKYVYLHFSNIIWFCKNSFWKWHTTGLLHLFKQEKMKVNFYMIFRTFHIIDNHLNIPLLVSPKLPQNIRSLSNLGKEKKEWKKKILKKCVIANQLSRFNNKHGSFVIMASINVCLATAFCVCHVSSEHLLAIIMYYHEMSFKLDESSYFFSVRLVMQY